MSSERRVEVTSAGWIHRPKQFCEVIGNINRKLPPEHQVRVEFYPGHWPVGLPMPGAISAERIHAWEREYGPIPVERFHMPFHYNLSSQIIYFSKSLRRWRRDWLGKGKAAAIALVTGNVFNHHVNRMAKEFDAGLNVHGYVAETAVERGDLNKLMAGSRYIYVENDSKRRGQGREGMIDTRDPQRAIDLVIEHDFGGMIWGVDHDFQFGINPCETFDKFEDQFRKHLRVIHLSGSSGDHSLIYQSDKKFWEFVGYISKRLDCGVVFCLDFNPLKMRKLSSNAQHIYVRDLVLELGKH
ncbi:hypothetical protein A2870_01685 [Candidatus Curtissbacteria bacterium RIFCSPHIGHO2_01_FULL_41_11]|uniref:Xylose isomerase-like TIM barrel domain-containing protein n=1 Tax=Candidatus Curtissbacteria bacterium RIFCSPHIGHO2_01_FULL_41_11 TaxID=1797711 RepID=A0A1F5G337_9BACT|nr:MAG: hypothetical protein A2870_01685 [Candidatus Curtissbacteria bacterium RIFCSPHIGHO2_01_FULL_41_11]